MEVPPVYSHARSHVHDKDPLVHVRVQWIQSVEEQIMLTAAKIPFNSHQTSSHI